MKSSCKSGSQTQPCRNTDDGKRFALVNFKQPEAAKAAVEALHKKDMRSEMGTEMLSVSGGFPPVFLSQKGTMGTSQILETRNQAQIPWLYGHSYFPSGRTPNQSEGPMCQHCTSKSNSGDYSPGTLRDSQRLKEPWAMSM